MTLRKKQACVAVMCAIMLLGVFLPRTVLYAQTDENRGVSESIQSDGETSEEINNEVPSEPATETQNENNSDNSDNNNSDNSTSDNNSDKNNSDVSEKSNEKKSSEKKPKYKYDKIGYTYKTSYILSEPKNSADKLKTVSWNTKVKYCKFNSKWACIKYDNKNKKIGYMRLSNLKSKECQNKIYTMPKTNGFKSWMPYTAITSKSSPQYKLQKRCYTGKYGIRMYDGRYCIAVGLGIKFKVGDYATLILKNGTKIPVILAEQKANKDTDRRRLVTRANGCVSEFLISKSKLARSAMHSGSMSSVSKAWRSPVKKIVVYQKNALK